VLVTLGACQPRRSATPSAYLPAADQSTLFLFLEPGDSGSEGLDLRIDSLSAIREDGLATPVPLVLDRIVAGRGGQHRLLAWGAIPAGRYAALGLMTRPASAPDAGGGASQVEGEEALATVPFLAEASRAIVLGAKLATAFGTGVGGRKPVLQAAVPDAPALGLIGLAADKGAGAVFLFDKTLGRVVRAVRTGGGPGGMAVDSGSARAYVPLEREDAIAVIDVVGAAIIGRITLTGGDGPAEVVLTPDGGTLLSANAGSGTVSVIDARAQVETGRVRVGNAPRSVLLNTAGTRAFVFNTLSNSVTVVDVAGRTVAATLGADSGPLRGAFDRAEKRLYVINRSSPYLSLFEPQTLTLTNRVYVGAGATALTVDPRSDRIYLARRGTRTVEIFDPFSFLPVDAIPVPGDVAHLAIDREGNTLFLSIPRAHTVRAIRLVGNRSVYDIDQPVEPSWVSFVRER
jgi:YVTN family beta-propeller protein